MKYSWKPVSDNLYNIVDRKTGKQNGQLHELIWFLVQIRYYVLMQKYMLKTTTKKNL
jgi:hypothetical protein